MYFKLLFPSCLNINMDPSLIIADLINWWGQFSRFETVSSDAMLNPGIVLHPQKTSRASLATTRRSENGVTMEIAEFFRLGYMVEPGSHLTGGHCRRQPILEIHAVADVALGLSAELQRQGC